MNYFGHPKTQWAGVDDAIADQIAVAQIGAEHTEAMRRERVDGIWPYMYAGWTRTRQAARVHENEQGSAVWKGGYAAPPSAAWHSALSPVLASLDLFDPDYFTAQEVTTDLYLINDSWHDAAGPRGSVVDTRVSGVHSGGHVFRQSGQQVELRLLSESGLPGEGPGHLATAE